MKRTIAKILAGITMVALGMTAMPSTTAKAASDVNVNISQKYQTIKGYGGMNHPVWTSDLTDSQRNTAFGNGDNQLGFNILRIHVDENKNNWSKELATAKAAQAKGALVFATPWNPPSYMTEPINKNGKQTKRLRYDKYGDYANYLNEFVAYMKNNGVNLYAISIQNEPDYAFEWTWWEPQEIYNFTKNYAGRITGCKVMSAESFSYNKNIYDKILNDPAALKNIDIIGTHFYGTQPNSMAYPLFKQKGQGKELWMTEVYVPNSNEDADKWPGALDVSTNINNAMLNDFQSYVWWYIRRSYGPMKENGQISKRGYCMAQFSKYIRPGYQRVDATKNPNTNISVSAYTGDGKAVVVAVNNGYSEVNQNFNINGGNIKSVDRFRTSQYENLAKTANMKASNSGFNANLPAKSVSTFVVTLGNGSNNNNNNQNQNNNNNNNNQNQNNNNNQGQTSALTNGWYYIKNVHAQKYLTVKDDKAASGQNVELVQGLGIKGQKWYLNNIGNGYVTLKSALGEFMLDVTGNKNADGTNIGIYNSHSGNAQQFMLKAQGNQKFVIATKSSNGTKALDDYNFGTSNGTNVCQWTCGGKDNQNWIFEKANN